MKTEFSSKLKWLRKHNKVNQETLGKVLGVGKSAISNYESGVSMPDSEKLIKIADFFNVSVDLLLGREQKIKDGAKTGYATTLRIPILASATPHLLSYHALDVHGYMELPEDLHGSSADYFALKMPSDSVDRLHIFPGDIVLVKKQSFIHNGEIAVVLIDDATYCVMRYYQTDSSVTLIAESNDPHAEPHIYDTQQTKINVLGRVIKAIINV